ncbi:DHHC palmitoyltransferase-domain-containing protein [Globomyces pollinis-pini]|nr:DHHC palmitoyltransferase-domain-containing protein [Globomyces pollinis-pini]
MKFHFHSCFQICCTALEILPPLFVIGITGSSFWFYITHIYYYENIEILKTLSLIIFPIITSMFIWSYATVVLTDSQSPRKNWMYTLRDSNRTLLTENSASTLDGEIDTIELEERAGQELLPQYSSQVKSDGSYRFCSKCNNYKPDRTHHCSTCKKCILKMDHHCPWIYNCVGFGNQKQFILFLFYGFLYSGYVLLSLSISVMYDKFPMDSPHNIGQTLTISLRILILMVCGLVFSVVFCIFLIMQLVLLLYNRTTIETMYRKVFIRVNQALSSTNKNIFYIDKTSNFLQVFGTDPVYWLIPVFSGKGDGYTFPIFVNDLERH